MGRFPFVFDAMKVHVVTSDLRKLGMNLIPFPRVGH